MAEHHNGNGEMANLDEETDGNKNKSGVDLIVQSVLENKVSEILFSGQETYNPILSMSDNLTKLAYKVDFYDDKETSADEVKRRKKLVGESDSSQLENNESQHWETIIKALKDSFIEIAVLNDILRIAKDRRYMVLDSLTSEQLVPKQSHGIIMAAKKKSLGIASTILLKGAERLSTSQAEASGKPDFYAELLVLRQHWKLRKVGNSIHGDLSSKPTSGKFSSNCCFEVSKAVDEPLSGKPGDVNSAIVVNIPPQLQGHAFVHVILEGPSLCEATPLMKGHCPDCKYIPSSSWQNRLENAHNLMFCKELFAQLAKDAAYLKAPVPSFVMGNIIRCYILPGITLLIELCVFPAAGEDDGTAICDPKPSKWHSQMLEHSLHSMLREVRSGHNLNPKPTTVALHIPYKSKLAGPGAYRYDQCQALRQSEMLLERIVVQARHVALRNWVISTLDNLAKERPEPQMVVHVSAFSDLVDVGISVIFQSNLHKTAVSVIVKSDTIKVSCKGKQPMEFAYNSDGFKELLIELMVYHLVVTAHSIARSMHWQIVQTNALSQSINVSKSEKLHSCLFSSNDAQYLISLTCFSFREPLVRIMTPELKLQLACPLVDPRWNELLTDFEEVSWNDIQGNDFDSKLMLLISSMSLMC